MVFHRLQRIAAQFRIDRPAAQQHFVMQVGAGGKAGGTDEAENIAAAQYGATAQARHDAVQMGVDRFDPLAVAQPHEDSRMVLQADRFHRAELRGVHRRTGGRAVIHSLVEYLPEHDGIEAFAEGRGHLQVQ